MEGDKEGVNSMEIRNRIISLLSGIGLLAGLLASPLTMAVPTGYGTYADSITLKCITNGCSGGGLGTGNFNVDEGVFGTHAGASVLDVEGQAEAAGDLVNIAPGLNTIELTGQAVGDVAGSNGNGGATQSSAAALDGYIYSGVDTDLYITATLTGTFTPPTSGSDSNLDGIFGTLYLFTNSAAISEINSEVDSYPYESIYLNCLGECYEPDDQVDLFISDGGSALEGDIYLPLLEAGDSFYLYATLGLGGAGGGSAVSLSSFDVSFSSTTGLESLSAASAVPVPAAVWLFGSGLLGLAGVARRRS